MAGSAFERLKKEFSVLKETTKDEFVIRQESDRKDREAKDRRAGGATDAERTEKWDNYFGHLRDNGAINTPERENKPETAWQKKTERNNIPSDNVKNYSSSDSELNTDDNESFGNTSGINDEISDIADELEDVTNQSDDDAENYGGSFDDENKDDEAPAEDNESENTEETSNKGDDNSDNSETQVEESNQEDNIGEGDSSEDDEDSSEDDEDTDSSYNSNSSPESSNESIKNNSSTSNVENSDANAEDGNNPALGNDSSPSGGGIPSYNGAGGSDSSNSGKEDKDSSKGKEESDEKQSKRETIKNKVNEKTKAAIAKNRAVRAVREAKRKIQNAAKTVKNGVMAIIKGIWIIIKGFIMPPFIGFWIILAMFLSLFVGGTIQTLGQNENRCFAGINGTGFTAKESTASDSNDRMLENASTIFDWLQQSRFLFLDGFGMSRNQAAAFVGNMAAENASFDPKITQNHWCDGCSNSELLARQNEMNNKNMGRAIGIIQWDNGRNTELVRFAEELNMPWYDLDTQLNFLRFELDIKNGGWEGNNLLKHDFNEPTRARTASAIALIVARYFFRCGDCTKTTTNYLGQVISIAETTENVQNRMANAAQIASGQFGLTSKFTPNQCANPETLNFTCEEGAQVDVSNFENGRIPFDALQVLTLGNSGGFPTGPDGSPAPGHLLQCEAAASIELLAEAFLADLGRPLLITSSYRTFEEQVATKARWCAQGKCHMAATPGKSNHGWGIALDIGSNVNNWNTREHNWMKQNAGNFGWTNPDWAQPGRGQEEPWHWEFSSVN